MDRRPGDTHPVRGSAAAVATVPSGTQPAPQPSNASRRRRTDRLRRWALRVPWPAVGLAFAGGLGLDAAFAPLQWWPVAVPATAAIVLAVRGRSWRAGLLIGFAAGLGEFLPLLSWLHVVTPAAWIALALISSVYVAALGGALAVVVGKVPGWPAWGCLPVGRRRTRAGPMATGRLLLGPAGVQPAEHAVHPLRRARRCAPRHVRRRVGGRIPRGRSVGAGSQRGPCGVHVDRRSLG